MQFKRALILGASGMIGAHAVRACRRRGVAVRALVRPHSDLRNLQGLDLTMVSGDLGDSRSLAAALDGCDLMIHAAAPYPRRHFGKGRLLSRARRGMQNLLDAGAAPQGADLCRMVYVSSVTTIGIPAGADGRPAPHSRPAAEDDDRHPVRDGAPYFAVKTLLEEMVLRAARGGLPAVVVNPTFCVDALDSHCTTGQLLIPLARGRIPAYLPGRLNAVPTRDVGEGICLAAERGAPGRRYILGAENMTSRELLERAAGIAGVRPPRWAMPLAAAEAVSRLTELGAYLTATRPLLPLTGIRMMKHSQAYDIRRARDELGFHPTGVDDALTRAFDWYRREGML